MPVEINEIASTVRAVDGDHLLDPRTLQRIVQAVVQALEDRERHDDRVRLERGVFRSASGRRDRGD